MVKGHVIKELYQLPDVSLVRHQFMVSGLPFTLQLVNYQGRVPVHFEQLDLEVNCCLDPKGAHLILRYVVCAVETQHSHERYILFVRGNQYCPNSIAWCIRHAVKPHNPFVSIFILYFLLKQGHDVLIREFWMYRLVVVDGLLSQVIYQGTPLYHLMSDINNIKLQQ